MVSKATNNSLQAANAKQVKGTNGRTPKKGSRVTQARSKAQRARLDKATEVRHAQEEQAAVIPATQRKKTARQDFQTNRRVIAVLIEAYLQDHIGGNSSEKTLEWHRTSLGLLRLFLEEELDITLIDGIE